MWEIVSNFVAFLGNLNFRILDLAWIKFAVAALGDVVVLPTKVLP